MISTQEDKNDYLVAVGDATGGGTCPAASGGGGEKLAVIAPRRVPLICFSFSLSISLSLINSGNIFSKYASSSL